MFQSNGLSGISSIMSNGISNYRSLGAAANKEESMLAEFVQKIISLAEPIVIKEDDGRAYSSKPLCEVRVPLIAPITVQTLAGFRDLYKLHVETAEPAFIHIHDHASVSLVAKKPDEWNVRPEYVQAQLPNERPFPFGSWLDPENFVIGLMCQFEDANYAHGDHRKVVKLVNSLAAEAVTISNDDGFSQQVVTRQGIVQKADEKVSPRVTLQPYRTFREISQPQSEFILRLKGRQGQMPSCALFEADGSEWKNEAMKRIREYLVKELGEGLDIVA